MASTIKFSKSDRIFNWVNLIFISLVFIVFMYPVYFVFIASVSDPLALAAGEVFFVPKNITLEGFSTILADSSIWRGYMNSFIYTITGTAFCLALSIPFAYAISRKDFSGRNVFLILTLITMFLHGGLIPTYLLVRNLGLLNTIWAVVLPPAFMGWFVVLARVFFKNSLPEELHDAAKLDGASDFRYFFSIVVPISKAIIAIIALFQGLILWNDYFNPMIFLDDQAKYPLQMILRQILIQNQLSRDLMENAGSFEKQQRLADLIRYSSIIVSSVPVVGLYIGTQKYFKQGVFMGSVKG